MYILDVIKQSILYTVILCRDDSFFDITVQCKLDILPQVYALVCGQLTHCNIHVAVVPVTEYKVSQYSKSLKLLHAMQWALIY